MGWTGKATPDGVGGFDISGGSTSGSGSGCGAIIIVFVALILVGGVVVEAVRSSSDEKAVQEAIQTPTTLQQEGVTFQGGTTVRPNPCDYCAGNYTYHRELQVSVSNTSSGPHVVVVCANQVSTRSVAASGPDCVSFAVAGGASVTKTALADRSAGPTLDGFEMVGSTAVIAIDNHPVAGAPFSLSYTADADHELAVCQDGGCMVPPTG